MKRKQWQRRLLSCFLAVAVLLGCLLCCLPVRAGAIVPLGLVQSALASYVTSTGYKMYNDQGTGDDILGSLGELYDDWVTLNNSTLSGSLATLSFISASPDLFISMDNSGHIVIKKAVADIFQQFSDWIKTEYSVPVGSDTPTQVVSSSGLSGDGTFSVPSQYYVTAGGTTLGSIGYKTFTKSLDGPACFCIIRGSNGWTNPFIASTNSSACRMDGYNSASIQRITYDGVTVYYYWQSGLSGTPTVNTTFPYLSFDSNYTVEGVLRYIGFDVLNTDTSSGVKALAVTLAQDVVNRAQDASDDESLVVAVGAGVGATAEDISGIVAQGVKAQTLDPSVTVVADAVIDTPVQPYPDIDGLGLPTLGAALVSRFPFCVPWDFVDTLRILNAAPIPPVFDVILVPASVAARWGVSGNYTLHVDLTAQEYAKLFVALRWGTLVGFCLGLALLTKRLIWTA